MPALIGFTVKDRIFFISSNFLPYFLLIYCLEQRWNASFCHVHIPEQLGFHWNNQSLIRQMFQQPIHCSAVPARLSLFLTRTLEPRISLAWMRWKKAVIISQQGSDSETCIRIKWYRSKAKATFQSINHSQSVRLHVHSHHEDRNLWGINVNFQPKHNVSLQETWLYSWSVRTS